MGILQHWWDLISFIRLADMHWVPVLLGTKENTNKHRHPLAPMELARFAEKIKTQKGRSVCWSCTASARQSRGANDSSPWPMLSPAAGDKLPQRRETAVSRSLLGGLPQSCDITRAPWPEQILTVPLSARETWCPVSAISDYFWLFHGLLVLFISDKQEAILPHWAKVKFISVWKII